MVADPPAGDGDTVTLAQSTPPQRVRGARRPVLRGALAAFALLAGAGGCTGADAPRFEVAELSPGPCRDMGTDLVEVERTQRELLAGTAQADAAAAGYAAIQDRLITVHEGADPTVADPVRALVTALGVYRIGAAADSLARDHGASVRARLEEVVAACGVELT